MLEDSLPLLDNTAWHSLVGPHAALAVGTDEARRYAPGLPPIAAFADAARPNFAALEPHCAPGEQLYCSGWTDPAPAGWSIHAETMLIKMVWDAPAPAANLGPPTVRLGPEHVPQMLALATLTRPGPFGPRALELGEYFGAFEGPRLVAMAGERMFAGSLREISGVCTHPDFQGRGLARGLMQLLLRRELRRGETPFLHVRRDNRSAHALYQRMGFRDRQERLTRVFLRTA
jgi:GNAT superfamily N-acetyltransferase